MPAGFASYLSLLASTSRQTTTGRLLPRRTAFLAVSPPRPVHPFAMRFVVLVAALALGAQGRTVQLEKMQQIGLTDANGQANFTNILAAGLNTQS